MLRKKISAPKLLADKEKFQAEVGILNADLRYFKGLSIMLLVMFAIIFFTFSALFGCMFLETRMMRAQLDNTYTEIKGQLVEFNRLVGKNNEAFQTMLATSQKATVVAPVIKKK